MLTSMKSHPCMWHCHIAAKRNTRVHPRSDGAIQFAGFECCGQHVGYPSSEGLPFADPWNKGVERTSVEGVEAAGSLHHHSSDCTVAYSLKSMCSCEWWTLFKHIFWTNDFWCVLFVSLILVSINSIDINMCKVLILRKMCYFCVWDFYMAR